MKNYKEALQQLTPYIWEIPSSFRQDMRVPARLFATKEMIADSFNDRTLEQLVNVTTLPGIQEAALAMPDAHEGYGFPIGGVAAISYPDGVVSPGGIGYDINCGVRLIKTPYTFSEIEKHLTKLTASLNHWVPSGVGRGGSISFSAGDLAHILAQGAEWIVRKGWGFSEDLDHIESRGHLEGVDPNLISKHAFDRGKDQVGTMGAGNHFVEIDVVSHIADDAVAAQFGLFNQQVVLLIHTGSRGLGHQVATDYIRLMNSAMPQYGITLPDRELACAPISSPEGRNYLSAMNGAANFAFANRQMITWLIRNAFQDVLHTNPEKLELLYDVAHNIAKVEEYMIGGEKKKVLIHRKGATRAFPGQPVLIPGSMGTASYVLAGTETAMQCAFGSTCHGAGRAMSRMQAKKKIHSRELLDELHAKGITVEAGSIRDLPEEAPAAYKDVDTVVDVVKSAGIATIVAKLKPRGVIKG